MKRLLFTLLLSVLPALAQAQTIDKYVLKLYLTGATAPLSAPTDLLASGFVCNQAPPAATTPTVNPTRIVMDDVAFPLPPSPQARVCIYTDAGAGPLFSLPFGTASYEGTLTPANSAGIGDKESNRAPFSHPGNPPGVPLTGVRFIK